MPPNSRDYFSEFSSAELTSQDGRSRLKFCTYAYEFPRVESGWDADWHRTFFHLAIPSIRVEINEVIFTGRELAHFWDELRALSTESKAQIEFKPLEPYFALRLSFTPMKKVDVKGQVQYPVGIGAKLNFEFETDLTYVDQFIRGIGSILEQFPPR